MITKPQREDTPAYYHYYIDLVTNNDLTKSLTESGQSLQQFIREIPSTIENYAYAPGKWTVKEVLLHILDAERIFQYRTLRFSRFDITELQGFNEDSFITNSRKMEYHLTDLADEALHVRNATLSLYKTLTDEMLDFKGIANNTQVTARGIGFMIVGHQLHHMKILQERYW